MYNRYEFSSEAEKVKCFARPVANALASVARAAVIMRCILTWVAPWLHECRTFSLSLFTVLQLHFWVRKI